MERATDRMAMDRTVMDRMVMNMLASLPGGPGSAPGPACADGGAHRPRPHCSTDT